MKDKIYIITEFRSPNPNERFINAYGELRVAENDCCYPSYYIVASEITPPKNATHMKIDFTDNPSACFNSNNIFVALPKKKVKKWRWKLNSGKVIWTSTEKFTEQEMYALGYEHAEKVIEE